MVLHVEGVKDAGICEDTNTKYYEIEVLEVILNIDTPKITEGEVVQVQTPYFPPSCGCALRLGPGTEYLWHLTAASVNSPVDFGGSGLESPRCSTHS